MAVFDKRLSKDGLWKYRARVRVQGAPAQTKSFTRLTDAKKWACKVENEIREGTAGIRSASKRHTVGELIDRYLEEFLPKKSRAMQLIQENQLRWWKKQLGPYLLTAVTPAMIIEQRRNLEAGKVQGGTSRTSGTCNRYIAALRHAYTVAVRDLQWTNDNPAKRVVKLREPTGRIRCLDAEERKVLLHECKASRQAFLYPIVVIALSTGMRYNEIRWLRWKQINFGESVAILYDTKNKRPRRVPLQGEALVLLKTHSRVRRIDTDLVFPGESDSTKPMDIRQAWTFALERAKLKNFCFHDLRHTAASYFAMSGASARDLCDIFGWETMQMAMRYAHLFDSHTNEIAERMVEKFLSQGGQQKVSEGAQPG